MDENRRLSIKRVEISLNNFNDIAIPHHIDLLKKHKTNIVKYQGLGDLDRIKNEQINATRIVVQLRNLLEEMDALRQQLIEKDLVKFDKMTEKSRNMTSKAIKEYMDLTQYTQSQSSPSLSSGYSSHSPIHDEEIAVNGTEIFQYPSTSGESQVALQLDDRELLQEQCKQEEMCLKSFEKLQNEVQDLHEIFVKFHDVTNIQKPSVDRIEENIEIADDNVGKGTSLLARAERFKAGWYPVAGALIGGCVAGPIGLITGLKVGGLALIGGTALGFTGGRFLKKKIDKNDVVTTCVKEDLGSVEREKED